MQSPRVDRDVDSVPDADGAPRLERGAEPRTGVADQRHVLERTPRRCRDARGLRARRVHGEVHEQARAEGLDAVDLRAEDGAAARPSVLAWAVEVFRADSDDHLAV